MLQRFVGERKDPDLSFKDRRHRLKKAVLFLVVGTTSYVKPMTSKAIQSSRRRHKMNNGVTSFTRLSQMGKQFPERSLPR